MPSDTQVLDEISKNKIMKMDYERSTRGKPIQGDLSEIRFWHDRRKVYPLLLLVAACIYAILISSTSSKRVFLP